MPIFIRLNRKYSLLSFILILSCYDFTQFDCFENEEGCNPNSSSLLNEGRTLEEESAWSTSGEEATAGHVAGESIAGSMSGVMITAGDIVSGITAGETIAGETINAGEMIGAGTTADETISAGTTAGETISAGTTAGETISAGTTAGETISAGTTAGETISAGTTAGETTSAGTTAGDMITSECDQNMLPICMTCDHRGQLTPLNHDYRCGESYEICPNPSYEQGDTSCYQIYSTISQSCVTDTEEGFPRCATANECIERSRAKLYSTMAIPCFSLMDCTGNIDNDIKWGCAGGNGVCSAFDDTQCFTAADHPCSSVAQRSSYRLRLCPAVNTEEVSCGFRMHQHTLRAAPTCVEICQELGLSCQGVGNQSCDEIDEESCSTPIIHTNTCFCDDPSDD